MILILALVGLMVLGSGVASLIRAIATDGGTRPTPRSHPEELGSRINQQLTR